MAVTLAGVEIKEELANLLQNLGQNYPGEKEKRENFLFKKILF
jgi:hypothetical protein